MLLRSGNVALSREAVRGTYRGFAGICARRFTRTAFDTGSLTLVPEALAFTGKKETLVVPMSEITGLTIESDTIIVTSRKRGVLFFDFGGESGKKWEDTLRKVLDSFHSPRVIREYYPRLLFEDSMRESPSRAAGHADLRVPVRKWYKPDTSPIFTAVRTIAKPVIKSIFSVDISGIENIPGKGSAVLLSNHTSFLDSIILGVFPRRHIWFMAKNSEYRGPVLPWALKRARAFPVSRYASDVQAVRNAIRIVQEGHVLGIYTEGERTWLNTLLPFRNGT
jgi:1-acyl-sn-glycerol-3-phosphate acyltransferase